MAAALDYCERNSEVSYRRTVLLMVWWSANDGQVTESAALWNRLRNEKSSLIRRVGHHEWKLEVRRKNIVGCQFGNWLDLIKAGEARVLVKWSLQNSLLHLHD